MRRLLFVLVVTLLAVSVGHAQTVVCTAGPVTMSGVAYQFTVTCSTAPTPPPPPPPPPPPVPVDCVPSAWSAWAPVGSCTNSLQSETRTRTIVTPAANGGLACGPLTESRSVACTVTPPPPPPPPPSGGAHSYFDGLAARTDLFKAYSLRDPKQLAIRNNGGYAQCNVCPLDITYSPATDQDPRKQDAAKMVVPAGSVSLRNYLYLPLGTSDGNTYLATWDTFWGAEWDFGNTAISTYKAFMFDTTTGLTSSNGLGGSCTGSPGWLEIRSRFQNASGPAIAMVDGRSYFPAQDPIPSVGTFTVQPDRWTRYWARIEQRANATDLVSLWAADEQTDAKLLIDKQPLRLCNSIKNFWIEMNTSTAASPPPRVAYLRNFIMLRGPNVDTVPMPRPTR